MYIDGTKPLPENHTKVKIVTIFLASVLLE